jgi:hypothetical protein
LSACTMFPRSTTASINRFVSGSECPKLAVTLNALPSPSRGFRPLSSEVAPGFSAPLSASPLVIESSVSLPAYHVPAFSPVDEPTIPSADFFQPFPPPLGAGSSGQCRQTSPGNAHPPSRLCPPHLRPCSPDRFRASKIIASSPSIFASIRFLFVRPALCPRLPSDSTSRWRHPCRPANRSPYRAGKGLAPSSECALPGKLCQRAGYKPAFLNLQNNFLLVMFW